MYSDQVLEHFMCPQNAYSMPDCDASGSNGSPECGDYIEVFIKVNQDVLTEVSYLVFGCAASVATSSMMSCLAKGKTTEQAFALSEEDVEQALGGLPEEKRHCSNLGIGALKNALKIYRNEDVYDENSHSGG